MELLYHFTIPLDPRTKKNHMKIAGMGARCPVCKKHARQFVTQGKAHERYSVQAPQYLHPRPAKPIDAPVWVKYHFYTQTRRRVDKSNLIACADDLLVDCGILADDNRNIIKSNDGTRVLYDKENPRTEIWIYAYKEEEDVELQNVHH